MKLTDGLFHNVFKEIALEYPEIESNSEIIDIASARLAAHPERYDVVVTSNLYGDIISDIAAEIAEINGVLRSIDDKTGLSGRNVAMGILFWPGIIVNQMNAGDAREAANDRLVVLSDLKSNLSCS